MNQRKWTIRRYPDEGWNGYLWVARLSGSSHGMRTGRHYYWSAFTFEEVLRNVQQTIREEGLS